MEKVSIDQWFEQMRNQKLSDSEKMQIYSRINEQVNKTLFINKFRRYAKAGSFVAAIAVAVLLFFAAYSPSSLDDLMVTDTTNSALTTLKPTPNRAIVTATTVGQLIKVEGDISVFKGEEEIETQNLDSGDIVLLKENARVELTVRQGVKATITGPARFTIEHGEANSSTDVYMLNLLEGEYVEIKALPKIASLIEGEKQETVIVKTKTIEIQQLPATRNLDVTISTQNGNETVENEGDDIIVKTINEDTDGGITVLARNEVYVVGNENQLTQTSAEQYTQELEEDVFAIRYEVEENGTALISGEGEEAVIDEESIDSVDGPVKRVLDQDILMSLERALSPQYIDIHITNIAQFTDNQDAQNIALGNLASSVNKARAIMGLAPVGPSLSQVTQGVSSLQVSLLDTYFVSPGLASRLYSIVSSIESIDSVQ